MQTVSQQMGTRSSHIQHNFQMDIRSTQQSSRLSIMSSGVTSKTNPQQSTCYLQHTLMDWHLTPGEEQLNTGHLIQHQKQIPQLQMSLKQKL